MIEPGLKLGLILQPLGPEPRLALRTCLPAIAGNFVAADVDETAGKLVANLAQDIQDESHRRVVPRAEDLRLDPPGRVPFARCPRQANSGEAAIAAPICPGILNSGTSVTPGVRKRLGGGSGPGCRKRTVGLAVAVAAIVGPGRLWAHRPDLREPGVLLHLDSPTLVVVRRSRSVFSLCRPITSTNFSMNSGGRNLSLGSIRSLREGNCG